MKIASGCVVELDYRLHLGDEKTVDKSPPDEPLSYLHGQGQIVPGLERELTGLSEGASKQVVVTPKDGYGEHDPEGIQEVPREAFPPKTELAPGMQFFAESQDGNRIPVLIKELKSASVVVDLNHPLAGKSLHFDVTVKSVRAATDEELSHGHAHGPGHEH
jgi:FKBP-type peptidyl-prolyl cis-trans isomerase SlyD